MGRIKWQRSCGRLDIAPKDVHRLITESVYVDLCGERDLANMIRNLRGGVYPGLSR